MEQALAFLDKYPIVKDSIVLLGILILAYLANFITHKILIVIIKKMVAKSKTKLDDFLIESKLLSRLAFIVPIVVVSGMSFLVVRFQPFISQLTKVVMAWIMIRVVAAFLNALNSYYETMPKSKERPIKGYIQVVIILAYILGLVFIIGTITGQSPWVLMSGIGAMTAVVLLIFKDTILSFVAGIQITSYDLIHVGDWIEMPEYGADGDVIDIALHTVKVQNWDKTITVIPTHKLTENSFKNWRGMQQSGGRRIKRALYIDQNSVAICSEELIERFKDIRLISDYVNNKSKELAAHNKEYDINSKVRVNRRQMTNIGTFRIYAQNYLESHPQINHKLTMMVRQLEPGPNGLPLEIYAFTNTTEWLEYEKIQADIFDHLLSVIDEFDLKIFQNPAGSDFRALVHSNRPN